MVAAVALANLLLVLLFKNTLFSAMGVSTEQWRLTIGCYHPHPHKNNIKHPHVNPQTRRTFVTTRMNVSLCFLDVFVVSFTVFGTTSLASAGLHTKVRILSTRIQTLHKPSLLICMDIHPDPGPFTVNNLPTSIRKLYNQVRRINSRIVRSRHRLRTFIKLSYGPCLCKLIYG